MRGVSEGEGVTHRSRGGPWPRQRSGGPGGRSAAACRGSRELRDSPDVGSHCVRTAPTACESACMQPTHNPNCVGNPGWHRTRKTMAY